MPRRLLLMLCTLALALPLLPSAVLAQGGGDEAEIDSVTPARVRGADRFETAARIAGLTFDQSRAAVVVTGRDFPDALAGSFAAGRLDAPILLVERDGVPASTIAALEDLQVEEVVLLGGTGAIEESVAADLEAQGYATDRIAGQTRYHTAAEVALRYGRGVDGLLDGDRTAILASGEAFPDALSAGPLAAAAGLPLLLTPPEGTPAVVDETLAELDIQRIVVVGGHAAVSDVVVGHHLARGYAVERVGGPTRDAVATAVADTAIARLDGFSARALLLARGDDFPDALAASIHAAALGAPILLAATPTTLGDATAEWLTQRCPDINVIRALGGTGALASSTLHSAIDAAGECIRPDQEVSRSSTPLLGNPDRTHNIHLAADNIDGDVIAPGDTYSLNQGIGRRTEARGFREVEDGCIGADGEPVDCVGGGVSQMGTTFLNAAWFAGIDLVEFRQHSLYFQRYPMCHEATLWWGNLDVRVRNDSPYDIVVDSFYDDTIVGVRFLSREWAEVSSWAEPQQPPSSGSFTSSCGRDITYPDGTTQSESYTWTYEGTGF